MLQIPCLFICCIGGFRIAVAWATDGPIHCDIILLMELMNLCCVNQVIKSPNNASLSDTKEDLLYGQRWEGRLFLVFAHISFTILSNIEVRLNCAILLGNRFTS